MVRSGLDAMDIRRIEAAILNSGSDFDRTMNPYQAGLDAFVDMKKADFIGKAALAVADRRPMLHGVHCADAEPLILGTRDAIRESDRPRDGRCVVAISAVWNRLCSRRGSGARAGRTDRNHRRGRKGVPGGVRRTPFYDREKKIPRGLESAIPSRD